MSLLAIGIIIIVLVLLCWVIQTAPIAQPFKWALMAVLVLLVCVWLLGQAGVLPGLRLR